MLLGTTLSKMTIPNRDQNGELVDGPVESTVDPRSQTEAVCILIFLLGLAVLVIGMNL